MPARMLRGARWLGQTAKSNLNPYHVAEGLAKYTGKSLVDARQMARQNPITSIRQMGGAQPGETYLQALKARPAGTIWTSAVSPKIPFGKLIKPGYWTAQAYGTLAGIHSGIETLRSEPMAMIRGVGGEILKQTLGDRLPDFETAEEYYDYWKTHGPMILGEDKAQRINEALNRHAGNVASRSVRKDLMDYAREGDLTPAPRWWDWLSPATAVAKRRVVGPVGNRGLRLLGRVARPVVDGGDLTPPLAEEGGWLLNRIKTTLQDASEDRQNLASSFVEETVRNIQENPQDVRIASNIVVPSLIHDALTRDARPAGTHWSQFVSGAGFALPSATSVVGGEDYVREINNRLLNPHGLPSERLLETGPQEGERTWLSRMASNPDYYYRPGYDYDRGQTHGRISAGGAGMGDLGRVSPGVLAHEIGHLKDMEKTPELENALPFVFGSRRLAQHTNSAYDTSTLMGDGEARDDVRMALAIAHAGVAAPMVAEETLASGRGAADLARMAREERNSKRKAALYADSFRAAQGLPTYVNHAVDPLRQELKRREQRQEAELELPTP